MLWYGMVPLQHTPIALGVGVGGLLTWFPLSGSRRSLLSPLSSNPALFEDGFTARDSRLIRIRAGPSPSRQLPTKARICNQKKPGGAGLVAQGRLDRRILSRLVLDPALGRILRCLVLDPAALF
jgi:hypothetical protein